MSNYERHWWQCQSQRQADNRANAATVVVIVTAGMILMIVSRWLWS
jgi:hypothetical protein